MEQSAGRRELPLQTVEPSTRPPKRNNIILRKLSFLPKESCETSGLYRDPNRIDPIKLPAVPCMLIHHVLQICSSLIPFLILRLDFDIWRDLHHFIYEHFDILMSDRAW